jgi:putative transposase
LPIFPGLTKSVRPGAPGLVHILSAGLFSKLSLCSLVTDVPSQRFYPLRMTQGLHRLYGTHDLHFLTFSCYRRRPFFQNAEWCVLFLETLERVRRCYRLVVLGYVVMPEHVHLLVSEPQREDLSVAMQALKIGFVRRLRGDGSPRSHNTGETRGTPVFRSRQLPKKFWQDRFYDFNVWSEDKRIEKLRYIHRNPVERGLVASPEFWLWSSFRWYSSREVPPVRINDTEILVMRVRACSTPAGSFKG